MNPQHRHLNKLKRFLKSIKIPIHPHPSYAPRPTQRRWPACWLLPDGLHFVQAECSVGRLAHEAGHWALIAPCDRTRMLPTCLLDQEIETCGEDLAAEAWAGAALLACNIGLEEMFTDTEDYKWTGDSYTLAVKGALPMLRKTHPGVKLMEAIGFNNYPNLQQWLADEETVRRWADIKNAIAHGKPRVRSQKVN